MTYLYILIAADKKSFKVGISDDVKKRVSDIERNFTKLAREDSMVYSSENRKLLNKVENGIHAYLNNHYLSPLQLGGGSTEWFEMAAHDKCMCMLEMYQEELKVILFEDNLEAFLKRVPDYTLILTRIRNSKEFMTVHSEAVAKINAYLADNIDMFTFHEEPGAFVLKKSVPITLQLNSPPEYPWFRISEDAIIFDVAVLNQWKQSGLHMVHKDLVETMFFNKNRLRNLKQMIDYKRLKI